jgi:hypothetical protein
MNTSYLCNRKTPAGLRFSINIITKKKDGKASKDFARLRILGA